ncbi:MAG: tetratricopeptide repeat protein [Pseudomonadota bacterium]
MKSSKSTQFQKRFNEFAELEQVEHIKKWCREYGVGVIAGIIFAIVVSVGWYYRQQNRENNLVKASIEYENLLEATTHQSKLILAKSLLQNYPQTPYASLAALQLAKQAVYHNKLAEAERQLVWIVNHGKSATLRAVARTRLARVLLAENQPERALQILDENDNKAYRSLILEEKGDVFFRLDHPAEALQNYVAAEKLYSESSIEQPLLSMKINNLK